MSSLQQQHVLIMGLGQSGLAMARWCVAQGARVTVTDTRQQPPALAVLQQELAQVRFVPATQPDAQLLADGVRAVFVSPGLSPAAVSGVVDIARSQGLWVGGELDLFNHALRQLHAQQGYAPRVLGITGTNGKTTTTTLTAHLLQAAGLSACVAGNIGPTLLDTLSQHMQQHSLPDVWVLELSSFQLNGCTSFSPTAAVVLNVTQDHLDWHGDMQAYAQAKSAVFGQQGLLVLNRQDSCVMHMRTMPGMAERRWVSFGTDVPQRAGDWGLEEVNGMVWLVRAVPLDDTPAEAVSSSAKPRRRTAAAVAEPEIRLQRLMPADALRIRGRHNASNALAALALATAATAALAPMLHGLREYRGEPHRVQSIGVVDGIEYVDDSKGTNVGATLAAIHGLGVDRRLVVILGGLGKGQDFTPLSVAIRDYVSAVVLIGQDTPVIAAALQDADVPLLSAQDMPDAVRQAAQRARAGEVVLLSPACASMDMFKDYVHRADAFRQAVADWAQERGCVLEVT